MLTRINLFSVLMTLNCFAMSVGGSGPISARSYGLFAFLVMVVLNASAIFRSGTHRRFALGLRVLGMVTCLGIILSIDRAYVWLVWYVPLLYLFLDISRPIENATSEMYLVSTAFVFALCYALSFHSAHIWFLLQTFSTQLSYVFGKITNTQMVLGVTGSGFWIFFSCLLCLFFAYRLHAENRSSRRAVFAIATGYLLIGYFAYTAYGQLLLENIYRTFVRVLGLASTTAPNFAAIAMTAPILFYVLAVGIAIVFLPRLITSQKPVVAGWRLPQLTISAISAGIVLIATLMLYLPATAVTDANRRVTFYGNGFFSWNSPQFGRYGTIQGGMFGLWQKHLQSMEYETLILKEDTAISTETLKQTDVFVVINLNSQFSDEERRTVWDYVADGGGLLVLGDHTDIQGTMKPLNHLLEPVNIKFRFDSAFTATQWFNAYELFPHPITANLDYSNDTLQHSTGASLDIAPPAVPIVNAKFAFSDAGNYENSNGYLGNYLYEAGEQLGDLPVIAGATYGKGSVVVFGDTSGFQNLAIYHSHELVNRTFSYLTSPTSPAFFKWGSFGLLCGVLLGHLLIPAARTGLAVPSVAVALGTGLVIGHALLPFSAPIRPHTGDIAYVDAAHVNQYSLKHWEDDSIDGLNINLARNRYLPMIRRQPIDESLFSAKLYVVIAPNKSFNPRELRLLNTYMHRGGMLILAVGWEEKAGAEGLLELLDLDVAPIPLGPVPLYPPTLDEEVIQAIQREPHFMEAWPIASKDASKLRILYGFGDYPIVVHKQVGDGGAIVISDTQFLYNRTLEAEKAWWEGNIIFFKQLLEFGLSGGTHG